MLSNELLRKLGIIAATGMLAGIAGCNTVEGVGEDVEAAGDEIQDEAEEF